MLFEILCGIAWKSTAVLAAAWAIASLSRKAAASVRHLIWLAAFAALLLIPLLELAAPRVAVPPGIMGATRTAIETTTIMVTGQRPAALPGWRDWIAGAWLFGVALLLGRLLVARALVSGMARRARPCPSLGSSAGESDECGMPVVFGLLSPVVILPADWREWPADKLRAVLHHERAHITRRDGLSKLAAQLVTILHWFQPLCWVAQRNMLAEQERACDDAVLRQGFRPSDYAQLLLDVARSSRAGMWKLAAVPMAARAGLQPRLTAVLSEGVRRDPATPRHWVAIAAMLACVCVPLAALRPPGSASVSGVVTDGVGAVAGAGVTLFHAATREHRESRTGPSGEFRFDQVPAGSFELIIAASGFAVAYPGGTVAEGQHTRVPVTLQPATPESRVEVTAPRGGPSSATGPQRIRVGGNIRPARLLSRVAPVYPEHARQLGIAGDVLLRMVVRTDGAAGGIAVVAAAHPDLADAAKQAVAQWRWEPVLLNGVPMEAVTNITISFALKE